MGSTSFHLLLWKDMLQYGVLVEAKGNQLAVFLLFNPAVFLDVTAFDCANAEGFLLPIAEIFGSHVKTKNLESLDTHMDDARTDLVCSRSLAESVKSKATKDGFASGFCRGFSSGGGGVSLVSSAGGMTAGSAGRAGG